jgi:hypothetical protein
LDLTILLASAGYDPRATLELNKYKFHRITGNSTIFSTHPSGNKRAELVAQTQVMEKALTIYNKNARAIELEDSFNAQVLQEIPLYLVVYLFCFWLLSMFFNFIFSSNIDFICKSAEVRIPNTQLILTIFKHNTLQT